VTPLARAAVGGGAVDAVGWGAAPDVDVGIGVGGKSDRGVSRRGGRRGVVVTERTAPGAVVSATDEA